MPFYEYKCDKCDVEFEKRISVKDRNSVPCPQCNQLARKKFSVFNVTWEWVMDGLTHDRARRTHDPYEL